MAYTADDLSTYMTVELGATGVALSLTDGSDAIDEAVNEVAALIGPIADQADDLKTRTVARWQAWRTARNAAAGQFDVALSGGKKFSRSQVFDHITAMLSAAEVAASRYTEVQDALADSSVYAYVSSSSMAGNPYAWIDRDGAG